MPELFSTVLHASEGAANLPDASNPYYLLTGEGLFLHRKTQIGDVLIREYKQPNLPKLGYPNGLFLWDGGMIPAQIISQATDFFKRVLKKHGTEAEVLITMHNETKAYKLFVPFQRVSHTGVKSIYEPSHIDPAYTVVGSIHSHCDFTAFHSGTDSADASDMDGVHFTIGMLQNDPPQIVAMVTMNKKEFHYPDPSEIAELNFHADTAPARWDQYIYPADTVSVKPKSLKIITQEQWDEFRGLAVPKPKVNKWQSQTTAWQSQPWKPSPQTPKEKTAVEYINYALKNGWSDWPEPTKESQKFNKKNKKHQQRKWTLTHDDIVIDLALEEAADANVINGDDWAMISASNMDDLGFWKRHFTAKAAALQSILETLDMPPANIEEVSPT